MIKITAFSAGECNILFLVEPTRPANIHEPKLGLAIAKASSEYHTTKEGKIYRSVTGIDMECSIRRLHEMRGSAQEEFSKKIHNLKNKLDEFNLLMGLTRKEKVKQ